MILTAQKICQLTRNLFFLVYIKMNTFALFTAETWTKNGVEFIKHTDQVWINQKNYEKNLGIASISNKTQNYLSELKKNEMRKTGMWELSTFLLKIL